MSRVSCDIVIVEDNPYDAELITRVIKKNNLTDKFVLLQDGVAAMDYLFAEGEYAGRGAADAPKVVLLDLKLPRADGLEVLRRIKRDERTKTIPVVVLTSSAEPRDLKAAYELGVNSYLAKPIKFEEFSRMVVDLGQYWLELNQPAVR